MTKPETTSPRTVPGPISCPASQHLLEGGWTHTLKVIGAATDRFQGQAALGRALPPAVRFSPALSFVHVLIEVKSLRLSLSPWGVLGWALEISSAGDIGKRGTQKPSASRKVRLGEWRARPLVATRMRTAELVQGSPSRGLGGKAGRGRWCGGGGNEGA